jgi:5-histidylcysteine sulfoxide synthase
MMPFVTRTPYLHHGSEDEMRKRIERYFIQTFDLDSSLYDCIQDSWLPRRADPLRHPLAFYVGHSAAFFINKLRVANIIREPVDPMIESNFAVGVDEMSWDDKLEDREWPHAEELRAYRQRVREKVLECIWTLPLTMPISWDSDFWTILMGIEHTRIHIETSSVLIRQLPLEAFNSNLPAPFGNICRADSGDQLPQNELLLVKGSSVDLGRPIESTPVYGWDNEFGEARFQVPDFEASKLLVSNGEYLDFMRAGGYFDRRLWTEEGWQWALGSTKQPKFWKESDRGMNLRTIFQEIPLPLSWPAVVNYHEAKAFCNWKSDLAGRSVRLPTEDEWFVMRQMGDLAKYDQPDWPQAPGNVNLEVYFSESPVDMFPSGSTGFYDIVGNVWQWSETPQHPFKGFRPHPFYDDFTLPCFGSEHNLIKGGSFVSTGNSATKSSRYQFRRHFYQHAGIRYVASDRDLSFLDGLFDDLHRANSKIDEETHFDYSGNLSANVAEAIGGGNRALVVGCATGRIAFELAKSFEKVVALERTTRLLGMGTRLQELRSIGWQCAGESYGLTVEELGYSDEVLGRIEFWQEDPANIRPEITGFDTILVGLTVESPDALIPKLLPRLNPGGRIAVLSSSEASTPNLPLLSSRSIPASRTLQNGACKALEFNLKVYSPSRSAVYGSAIPSEPGSPPLFA